MSNIKYLNPEKYNLLMEIYNTGQSLLKTYGADKLNIKITCKDKEMQGLYEVQEKERKTKR